MKRPLAAATAACAAGGLAFGSALPAGAASYFYAGGTRPSGQPSQTSEDEWRAFVGQNHQPQTFTVQYPRDLAPLIGTTTLDRSVAEGVAAARRLISAHDDGGGITLVGVSQGAVVMYRTKQALIDDTEDGIDAQRLTVYTFGDPVNADGGLLARLDGWNVRIPGFRPSTHIPGEGTYVTFVIEYDLIADSPDNVNPVSWVNAALGATYDHATYSASLIEDAAAEQRVVSNAEEWYQAADDEQAVAYYQHNLVKQKNLPLTRPLRDIGTSVADDEGDVAVNRLVDRLDNVLRPVVDAGYDGGQPGGSRHVNTLTKHYGNETAGPSSAESSARPMVKRPIRDAIRAVRNTVTKIKDSLTRPANEKSGQ